MKLRREEAPVKRSDSRTSLYTKVMTRDMMRLLRSEPGVSYLLIDDTERAMCFTKAQVNRLQAGALRPIRVQSRQFEGREGKMKVYFSYDPAYWIRSDEIRAKRKDYRK